MLQPKKPNPAQKTKRKTAQGQYTSDIDWDQVRSVNDNVEVQTAKMFDPTGISSYPDVYYAAKDLSEGKRAEAFWSLIILRKNGTNTKGWGRPFPGRPQPFINRAWIKRRVSI